MMSHEDFLNTIAPIIVKEAKERGYNHPSAIIAQAILESGWGSSPLSKVHNYFGMKCGSSWTGKFTYMQTQEQKPDGSYITINAKFRAYSSVEEGIKGYFDFINKKRYNNLKQAESPQDYLQKIKDDGYATSHNYVQNNMRVVKQYDLQKYDTTEEIPGDLAYAIDIFANYIIAGFLGSGEERKNRIYKLIQDRVNERLNK